MSSGVRPHRARMAPWPALASSGRSVPLGKRGGQIFLFDSGEPPVDFVPTGQMGQRHHSIHLKQRRRG